MKKRTSLLLIIIIFIVCGCSNNSIVDALWSKRNNNQDVIVNDSLDKKTNLIKAVTEKSSDIALYPAKVASKNNNSKNPIIKIKDIDKADNYSILLYYIIGEVLAKSPNSKFIIVHLFNDKSYNNALETSSIFMEKLLLAGVKANNVKALIHKVNSSKININDMLVFIN